MLNFINIFVIVVRIKRRGIIRSPRSIPFESGEQEGSPGKLKQQLGLACVTLGGPSAFTQAMAICAELGSL